MARPPYRVEFYESEIWYWADAPEGPDGMQEFSGTLTDYTLDVYDKQTRARIHNESYNQGDPDENMSWWSGVGTPTVQDPGYWEGTGTYSTLLKLDPKNWDTPPEGGKHYIVRIQYGTTNEWERIVTRIDPAICAHDRRR